MNCTKSLATLVCFTMFVTFLDAQDKLPIKFGKVSLTDFAIKSAVIDSNTNAVVIADVGTSEFIANTTDLSFSIIFKRKQRIKLINKNGFDAATITIPLYRSSDGREEKLEDLNAHTYNIENGEVIDTKLEKAAVFTQQETKNWTNKKFTFPAIKEGSIVEFTYQVKSDFFFNFQSWEFQRAYPVLWSQYDATIPEFFKYVILSQGYHPFVVKKTEQSRISFLFRERTQTNRSVYEPGGNTELNNFNIDGNIEYHTWIMKDVPAIKEEPFTTTIRNSIAKVEFQLKQIAYPNTVPKNYMNTWEKASDEMLADENFGIPIKRTNNWLDEDVNVVVKNAPTPVDKAKKIYAYVRDNFTCTNYNRTNITTTLKDVIKTKSGSVADINLLLIAMLRNQHIAVEPVILSTRTHGITNQYYPIMDKFNYVIAQVVIDGVTYHLDASQPRLAFARLPLNVYNGHARVVNETALPVFFVADSIAEGSSINVFISNIDKGGVEGAIQNKMGYYQSLSLRNKIAKSSLADYTKSLSESYTDEISINNIQIDSLKILDEPVELKYELKLKLFGEADIVYFNPFLGETIKKNPFTAAERFYPVEMPYTQNDVYSLNMEIPAGYKVDELPKSTRIMLNEDEGMFEYLISNDGSNIQMRSRLVIKKANFLNEDYQTLRDFYAFIVNKEAEQIVFKKIK